jgi:hypothetical protein
VFCDRFGGHRGFDPISLGTQLRADACRDHAAIAAVWCGSRRQSIKRLKFAAASI